MIVLDASTVIELVLNQRLGAHVARRVADLDDQLHAPHLLTLEVVQVVRRREAAGLSTSEAAATALTRLADLDVSYHDVRPLVPRIWELRRNLTAYDASYVALAESLPGTLLTADARLARASGHRATIELVTS